MKIGIIGNGFVGRATQIFAKNYYGDGDGDGDNVERYEVLPNTPTTPAKPKSVYTMSAGGSAPPRRFIGSETLAPAPLFQTRLL